MKWNSEKDKLSRESKVYFLFSFSINILKHACQTGGPRAACGPTACYLRPAVIFSDLEILYITHKMTRILPNLRFFDLKWSKYSKPLIETVWSENNIVKTDKNIGYFFICGPLTILSTFKLIMWLAQQFEFDMPVLKQHFGLKF